MIYTSMMSAIGADRSMEAFVRGVLRLRRGEKVLDVGCGPGRLCRYVPSCDYWGIDRNERALRSARRKYPQAASCFLRLDPSNDAPELRHSGQGLPVRNFDVIVACGLVHHLPDERARGLFAFCRDHLRTGGRLVTVDCAYEPGQHLVARLLAACDRGRFARTGAAYLELAREYFPDASLSIHHDLLRVPYTHAIVECRK
jgi:cyclopropane fatty-acyl-phospholipid synthase-like methyltransferase